MGYSPVMLCLCYVYVMFMAGLENVAKRCALRWENDVFFIKEQ